MQALSKNELARSFFCKNLYYGGRTAKRQISPQVKEKIVLDYYNHFGKFLLTFTIFDLYVYLSMYINNLILVFLCKTFLKKSKKT